LRSKLIFWGTAPQYFWVDCLLMGGDGQTVLNFVGTGTIKFSGGLFRGVNSYFGGTGTTLFLGRLFRDG
jgi:hypothetical protein